MMERPGGMSAWRDERNARALVRLAKARPAIFPAEVLVHAHARALMPPLPSLAVASYWTAHPLRADRLARSLAALSGSPPDWHWQLSIEPDDGRPASFRLPPAPYRETAFTRGPGWCRVCGQPVYRFGWHRDLWNDGTPNRRAGWHAACVAAWKLWTAPITQVKLLGRLQKRRCPATGARLLRGAEVDHRLPLFRVWREHRDADWPTLLSYWGFPNLQAINLPAHRLKSAGEAGLRAALRGKGAEGRAPETVPVEMVAPS